MKKIAFLYPGQGSQYIGMGKDFYINFEICKRIFDEASEVAEINIADLCFIDNTNIDKTEYTQIALVTVEYAITAALLDMNIVPSVTAGLSLGEYTALITANALQLKDAIKIVQKRGRYMQEAVKNGNGKMAVIIGLSEDIIHTECKNDGGIVQIANYNSEKQTVIYGETKAVDRVMKRLDDLGAKIVSELAVSIPSHCILMKDASYKLINDLNEVRWSNLSCPYIPNVTAKFEKDINNMINNLTKQLYSPVYWHQSIMSIWNAGIDTMIEIGPGQTLTKLNKKINKSINALSCGCCEDLSKIKQIL